MTTYDWAWQRRLKKKDIFRQHCLPWNFWDAWQKIGTHQNLLVVQFQLLLQFWVFIARYKTHSRRIRTEREGFEPSTEVTSCNSLAGSRFQPLSHLSITNTLSSQTSKKLYCDPLQILRDNSRKSISKTAKNFPWNWSRQIAPILRRYANLTICSKKG